MINEGLMSGKFLSISSTKDPKTEYPLVQALCLSISDQIHRTGIQDNEYLILIINSRHCSPLRVCNHDL